MGLFDSIKRAINDSVVSAGNGQNITLSGGRVWIDGVEQSAQGQVQGAGPAVERGIAVGEFSAVESSLPISIVWAPGAAAAKLATAENLHAVIEASVVGSTLVVRANANYSGAATLTLSSAMVERVALGGGSTMQLEGLSGESFEAELSGASRLSGEGSAGLLRVKAGGSSRARLQGVHAQGAIVRAGGSSKAKFSFSREANVECGGSSECEAFGGGSLAVDCSGSSEFLHRGGVAVLAEASVAGSSKVDLVVGGASTFDASGSGRIRYAKAAGANAPQSCSSGSSSIKERPLEAGEGLGAPEAPSLAEKLAARSPPAAPVQPAPGKPPAPNTARGRR